MLVAAPENLRILRLLGKFMESREVSCSPLKDCFSRSLREA